MVKGPEGSGEISDTEGNVSEADVVFRVDLQIPEDRTPIGVTIVDDMMFTTQEGLDAYLRLQEEGGLE